MNVRNNQGSAIPLVMIISALVFIFSYVIFGMLQSRRQGSEDDLKVMQAKMLAADIVELGKYIMLYERVMFLDNPLKVNTARTKTRKEFLEQSYGAVSVSNATMLNACGGFDAMAVEIGTFKDDNDKSQVFCPYYLRNPMMDGKMFEEMMLGMWSRDGASGMLVASGKTLSTSNVTRSKIMTKNAKTGAYELRISLNDVIKSTDNQYIRLHLNQNIVSLMRQGGFTADLIFSFYGPSTGFTTQTNERFVNIQADVSFGGALNKKSVNTTESIIVYSTTVKDFALFIMYPETSTGNPTTQFSQAVKLPSTARINGRVFFNGNIDTALDKLPTFSETVVISGELNVSGFTYEKARELIAAKFKKGIVTRYPVQRLVNDGNCVSGMTIANNSGMYCKDPNNPATNFNIKKYIEGLTNMCANYKVSFASNGTYEYDTAAVVDPVRKEQCKGNEKIFLSGGSMNVSVSGTHAFVISPAKKIVVAAGASVYGSILGGYVQGGANTKFYSLASLRKGLPGINDDVALQAVSREAERIVAGVGVPLVNLALMKDVSVGK